MEDREGLHKEPFLTLMMDETADTSDKERLHIVIRMVSDNFDVNEELIGLHEVPSTDTATLTSVAKDTFIRLNLLLYKLRGQCYDGASSDGRREARGFSENYDP